MDIWAGLAIGFFGSFHCVGMCGPIAIALPVFTDSKWVLLYSRILYNLGRVITYAAIGALFGLFGNRLALAGFQQDISIFFGVVIILYVILPRKIKTAFAKTIIYRAVSDFVKGSFQKVMKYKSSSSLFVIGLLNGLLPCGFVYVALAGAMTTGDFLSGAGFMALFGFGTFPIMLAASLAGKFINVKIRQKINKLIPALAVLLAMLFILRGLSLGIPYISPKLSNFPAAEQEINCH
ncbi:MAG: sulfite exporter TauE/SafE family protein [Melioribacteraceae bacterium]|nr:sulfite exporter TauE/SafE family protein [Melioribacteraceae bacterium]MCF8355699.1 sulfite exporter TauE/SafE family protein [Melioribacteraceae bacterium]MCF8394429.1 sulfite exporter TauE/SafE family protein [Melioribacteraceae bacterium]MCF8418563.1 sulfite exporter TauE/SafE family protein [Melioribacteraceae bacterium]